MHSLRIVEILENEGKGLNLTEEVKDGISKHSKGKGPIVNKKIKIMTLEGAVVRYSDIFAYFTHDLDDALRSSLIKKNDILYEPDKQSVIKKMIPRYLNIVMWQYLLESNASEQAARMLAMENATENAGEMIKDLGLQYNKARQSAITTEIIEIVSGANALSS